MATVAAITATVMVTDRMVTTVMTMGSRTMAAAVVFLWVPVPTMTTTTTKMEKAKVLRPEEAGAVPVTTWSLSLKVVEVMMMNHHRKILGYCTFQSHPTNARAYEQLHPHTKALVMRLQSCSLIPRRACTVMTLC